MKPNRAGILEPGSCTTVLSKIAGIQHWLQHLYGTHWFYLAKVVMSWLSPENCGWAVWMVIVIFAVEAHGLSISAFVLFPKTRNILAYLFLTRRPSSTLPPGQLGLPLSSEKLRGLENHLWQSLFAGFAFLKLPSPVLTLHCTHFLERICLGWHPLEGITGGSVNFSSSFLFQGSFLLPSMLFCIHFY